MHVSFIGVASPYRRLRFLMHWKKGKAWVVMQCVYRLSHPLSTHTIIINVIQLTLTCWIEHVVLSPVLLLCYSLGLSCCKCAWRVGQASKDPDTVLQLYAKEEGEGEKEREKIKIQNSNHIGYHAAEQHKNLKFCKNKTKQNKKNCTIGTCSLASQPSGLPTCHVEAKVNKPGLTG